MKEYLSQKFNQDDPEFISVQDELPYWSAPFGLKLIDQLPVRKNMNVLDIGCGFGFPLIEIAERLGNSSRVFGLDPWRPALERAEKKITINSLKNVKVIEGAAENIPFTDNFFDLIVSNNGINNVADMKRVFGECYRSTKRGGQLLFTVNLDKTFMEFYNIFQNVLEEKNMHEEIGKLKEHIYQKRKPVEEIIDLIHNTGYTINSLVHYSFSYSFADAKTLFNYPMIKNWFLPSWVKILPEGSGEEIFSRIEEELNIISQEEGCIKLSVPYILCSCEK